MHREIFQVEKSHISDHGSDIDTTTSCGKTVLLLIVQLGSFTHSCTATFAWQDLPLLSNEMLSPQMLG
jgi:hypothetical protein